MSVPDIQIVDLVWIDSTARGLTASAAANVKSVLAAGKKNYVLINASTDFARQASEAVCGHATVIPVPRSGGLVLRELLILWLAVKAMLARQKIVYTSWLPRLAFFPLVFPIESRIHVHDLNIFRKRIYDDDFAQPSFLSRAHQFVSIKRATQAYCFSRSVQKQIAKIRGGAIPSLIRQHVHVPPLAGAANSKQRMAAIFLDSRSYKGAWMLDRLYSSGKNFELVVVGDITESKANRLRAKGVHVRSLRPSDNEKFQLLSEASCVIFASKYEGFGIPPREAAAVGTPSLIARRAALMDIPKSLSISIDDFANDIDLDEISRLAAKIDRMELKAWAQAYVD